MAIQSANTPEQITLVEWKGINASASRGLIDDQELHWCENFFPVAIGQLRAGWGPSAPLWTAPAGTTIRRLFTANITGSDPSIFAFTDDGNVTRINIDTQAAVNLGALWTPTAPQYWADLKLWQPNQYGFTPGAQGGLVIGSPKGLYAVSGNDAVAAPGQAAPAWLTGGTATTMPTGLPGIYALEVYQSRLWVMGKTVVSFSAAVNGANFSTAGGGGSFGYLGDQLTVSYTDMAQAGGFLFLFADSCINVIANVQLVGSGTVYSPFTTVFQLSNVDPQNGQAWWRPVGHWGNIFILVNGSAFWAFQGQQAQVISQKIINLRRTLDPTVFAPTMAPADIHGRRWMLVLGNYLDPWGIRRSLLLCWDGQIWVAASQHYELTHLTSYEHNSMIRPYGTDGRAIYELFAQPDPALPKLVSTKAFKGPNLLTTKDWKICYLEMRDALRPKGPQGVSLTGTISTADGGIPNGKSDVGFDLPPGGFGLVPHRADGKGISAWVDLKSLSPDFVLERLTLTYDERSLFGA